VPADRAWALHWNGRSWKQVIISQLGQLRGVAVNPHSGSAWAVGAGTGPLMMH
jgi:hypothetical protein